jgi:hypothetical protein
LYLAAALAAELLFCRVHGHARENTHNNMTHKTTRSHPLARTSSQQ